MREDFERRAASGGAAVSSGHEFACRNGNEPADEKSASDRRGTIGVRDRT